jgi:hypothetical protein
MAAVCFALAALVHAQSVKPAEASGVQCSENVLSAKSPYITSHSGIAARALVDANSGGKDCAAKWKLEVRTKFGFAKTLEVASTSENPNYELSFELYGWSSDNRLLLGAIIRAMGDWDQAMPMIYDVQAKQQWVVDLQPLFARLVPKDCSIYAWPDGFSQSGDVLIHAGPRESDMAGGEKPCFTESEWQLNYRTNTLAPAEGEEKPDIFGKLSDD